jgi:hypothetical protein
MLKDVAIPSAFGREVDDERFYANAALVAGRSWVTPAELLALGNASVHGFFDVIGDIVSAPVKAAKLVVNTASDVVKMIPVVGTPLSALVKVPGLEFAANVLSGANVSQSLVNEFKAQVAVIRDVGPLASKIVAFVPGIGTGVAAGIGAASALANGQSITDSLIEAAKAALPGSGLAKLAVNAGVDAIGGKAIASNILNQIPKGAQGAFNLLATAAKGVKVPADQLARAAKALPQDIARGFTVGVALGAARKIQNNTVKAVINATPKFRETVLKNGKAFIDKQPIFQSAGRLLNGAQKTGFIYGCGMMSIGGQTSKTLQAAKKSLANDEERKGFDLALAARTGLVTKPIPKVIATPKPVVKPAIAMMMTPYGAMPVQTMKAMAAAAPVQPLTARKTTPRFKVVEQAVKVKAERKPSAADQADIDARNAAREAKAAAAKEADLRKFAYLATEGMSGAESRPEQMALLAANPIAREGAVVGVKEVAERRKGVWTRIKEWFGFHGEELELGEYT